MKILVTGGLGTIGRPLVRELRTKGHEVRVCDLSHHHDLQYSRCDVSKFRQIEQLISQGGFEYVYHLAAEFGRWNGEDYYENLWLTNVVGTKNLIRLQEKYRFRMIFFSSSEVYGDWSDVMTEDVMDLHEVKQLNDYAMTKWVSEQQVLNSAAMEQTETVRVRLFNTYGPGEHYSLYRSVVCRFVYSALHDLPYTVYLNHNRSSTYVSDVVRTLGNITDNFEVGEVYNIGGSEFHDIKQLSDLILEYIGKTDEMVDYKEAEPFTTKDKKVDVTKAERDLGLEARVSLQEGIPLTIEWMSDVYGVQLPHRP